MNHSTIITAGLNVVAVFFGVAHAQEVSLEYAVNLGVDGGDVRTTEIVADSAGNAFATGYFSGVIDFDPGLGVYDLASEGEFDVFLCKLDANGVFQWVTSIGGPLEEIGFGVALDGAGNAYVTGANVELDLAKAEQTDLRELCKGYTSLPSDLFVAKFGPDGDILWNRVIGPGNRGNAFGHGLVAEPAGSVYATGYFSGTVDFDPGSANAVVQNRGKSSLFVLKLDSNGTYEWVRTSNVALYSNIRGEDIALDEDGYLYAGGYFEDEVDLNSGPGEARFTSAGADDVFIQKLDIDGNYVWAKTFGGPGRDVCTGVAVDSVGAVYTTGAYQDTVDFDPSAAEMNATELGETKIFIHKLDGDGSFHWVKTFGATENSSFNGEGRDITIDRFDNVWTTGHFYNTVDFDPGEGVFDVTGGWGHSIFVQKMQSNGDFLWAGVAGTIYHLPLVSIASDGAGSIRLAGVYGNYPDFDPGEGNVTLEHSPDSQSFISKLGSRGEFAWVGKFGGRYDSATGEDMAVDSQGNVYTTGHIFEPANQTSSATGRLRMQTYKLDSDGKLVWMQNLSGGGNEVGAGIATDRDGNVYTAGFFTGVVDLDPGLEREEHDAGDSLGYFVRKQDTAGDLFWVRSFDVGDVGSTFESVDPSPKFAMAVDLDGNVHVAGPFRGTVDFDPGAREAILTEERRRGMFVQKLDPVGSLVWVRSLQGTDDGVYQSLTLDEAGNLYAAGFFQGDLDFDPGVDSVILSSPGGTSTFIHKIDAEGRHVWAGQLGGASNGFDFGTAVNDLVADCMGNVYVTGRFRDTVDFNPGPGVFELTSHGVLKNSESPPDIFILKLDEAGNFVWARATGGDGQDEGRGIAVDRAGNIYITGSMRSPLDFDGDGETEQYHGALNGGMFVQKSDPEGNFVWAQVADGLNSYSEGAKIAVGKAGDIYVMGQFGSRVDFDPGEGVHELNNLGGEDIFVVRLSQSGEAEGETLCAPDPGGMDEDLLPGIAETLRSAFELIDLDNSEALSAQEAFEEIPGMTQLHFSTIDSNSDGELSKSELAALDPSGEGEGEGEGPIFSCPDPTGTIKNVLPRGLGDIFLLGTAIVILLGLHRLERP